MSKTVSQILLISESGRLRDSLRVLLKSCSPALPIEEAKTASQACQYLAEHPQALPLIDADLLAVQLGQVLNQFETCLVLAHSLEQQEQAQSQGIRAILLEQFSAATLCAAMESQT